MRLGSVVVVIWLVIGVFAAFQRGYFDDEVKDCNKAASIAAVIVVGPLNYLGVNPKIDCNEVDVPEPSQ